MDPQELARENDKAAKSNLQEELALLEEKIKLAALNFTNKASNTNLQDDSAIPEQILDPEELSKKKEETATVMRKALEKWGSEKEKNEEEIEKIRKRKEERKKESEEEQALLLSMKKEDEAQAAIKEEEEREAEEEKQKIEIDHQEIHQQKKKQNFSDQKKFKTREERDLEEGLADVIKPFDVKTMNTDQLKQKASELYGILVNLESEKIHLNTKMIEQDSVSKNLREKLSVILDEKSSKKGYINMEKYYPGKTGKTARKEAPEKDDMAADTVLVSVWEEKFNAWMNAE